VKEEHREIFRNYWTADVGTQKEILKKQGHLDFFR